MISAITFAILATKNIVDANRYKNTTQRTASTALANMPSPVTLAMRPQWLTVVVYQVSSVPTRRITLSAPKPTLPLRTPKPRFGIGQIGPPDERPLFDLAVAERTVANPPKAVVALFGYTPARRRHETLSTPQ
jgi:hypothetical protein